MNLSRFSQALVSFNSLVTVFPIESQRNHSLVKRGSCQRSVINGYYSEVKPLVYSDFFLDNLLYLTNAFCSSSIVVEDSLRRKCVQNDCCIA